MTWLLVRLINYFSKISRIKISLPEIRDVNSDVNRTLTENFTDVTLIFLFLFMLAQFRRGKMPNAVVITT
jgi:hypothetical protein